MKKTFIYFGISLIFAFSTNFAFAASMRCGSDLVSEGDLKIQVLKSFLLRPLHRRNFSLLIVATRLPSDKLHPTGRKEKMVRAHMR